MAAPPFTSLRHRDRSDHKYGTLLRSLRQRSGVTEQQLADALGVTDVFISDVELGQRTPMSSEKTFLACKFLGVDPMPLLLSSGKRRSRYDLAIGKSNTLDLEVGAEIALAWYELSEPQIRELARYMKGLVAAARRGAPKPPPMAKKAGKATKSKTKKTSKAKKV